MLIKYLAALSLLAVGVWCAPSSALLGAKECTWGPSYWCKNLTSAHGCAAVKHCITTVWEHKKVPQDNDDICTICKNMVTEARDQLESNMTMEELKDVFDGTCKLIYIKPAVRICTQLADQFVPELVDTISSQMNPDVVCSVAGLCNNAEIDVAIDENKGKGKVVEKKLEGKVDYSKKNCDICAKFANQTAKQINESKPEDILGYLLDLCGKTSSYSDSCASLVLMHQTEILQFIQKPRSHHEVCTLTGSCISQRVPLVGDETCDLCQQLVKHFKDIITADTTESEFKKVLLGVCKQTGKFQAECEAMVNEYSDQVFRIISNDLDGKVICGFLNICPAPGVYVNGPVAPMLPVQPVPVTTPRTRPTIAYGDSIYKKDALPAERLVGKPAPPPSLLHDTQVNGEATCEFCQYALHYIQKVVSQPYAADAIKKEMDKICDKLPESLTYQCRDFVNLYGDAFCAILAQEIDPSQVCPSLKVCPAQALADRYEPEQLVGLPGCPLCLMAIDAVDQELANNKTEESVKAALDKICTKLPGALRSECLELVSTYTEELVDMILADFTPEEVCTYLKICKKPGDVEIVSIKKKPMWDANFGVMTNEVALPEEKQNLQKEKASPGCVLCEFVLDKIDSLILDNKTQVDIDLVLNGVCKHLPGTIRADCQKFVVKYAEEIINTLASFVPPQEVCSYMGLCMPSTMMKLRSSVQDCFMCRQLGGIHNILVKGDNENVDRALFLFNACDGVEDSDGQLCRNFMRTYGVSLFNSLKTESSTDDACSHLAICSAAQTAEVKTDQKVQPHLVGTDKCTHGPGYWCKSRIHPLSCGDGAVKHCQENVWPAPQSTGDQTVQPAKHLLGTDKCTHGPGYWCKSRTHAQSCGDGAVKHCEEKVWPASI